MKRIVFIAAILFVLTACQKGELEYSADFNKSSDKFIEESEEIYTFHEDAVKEEIESYFEKDASELTKEDFETLSKFTEFEIKSYINTIDDIPKLFPDLKYINIKLKETASENTCNILESMENLKAVTIYSAVPLDTKFAENLSYVEISYGEDINSSELNNLADFSVLESEYVLENMNENIKKFVRIVEGDNVFELTTSGYIDNEEGYYSLCERKVFVSEKESGNVVCKDVLDFTGEIGAAADSRLYLIDVDFNGEKDILVDNGHFGNQGAVVFTCFLNNDGQYEKCDSFADIPNPSVDADNEKVLSTWRNWALSHSWAMYSYINGKFEMIDCLTEEADVNAADDEQVWIYIVENFINGELKETVSYSTKDISDEEIKEMFFIEGGYWEIFSDKWRTIFNRGTLIDFSIYDSSSSCGESIGRSQGE